VADAAPPAPEARTLDAAPVALDAAAVRRRRADARVALAAGSVRVGASPWADVYLDGAKIGRAPGSFEIAAGRHALELRYQDQTKILDIDIQPGELTSLGVHVFKTDFDTP
jgi:hypothetical protein